MIPIFFSFKNEEINNFNDFILINDSKRSEILGIERVEVVVSYNFLRFQSLFTNLRHYETQEN